jgi:hypothetical protein
MCKVLSYVLDNVTQQIAHCVVSYFLSNMCHPDVRGGLMGLSHEHPSGLRRSGIVGGQRPGK